MPEFTGTTDIRSYLRTLWRWKWLLLVFVVAAPCVAYLLEHGKPKTYRSSALVGVNQTTVNTAGLSSGGSFSTTNVTAIAELVTTTPVADVAASLLSPPARAGQIAGEVSAVGDATTNFLTITATDRSPARAAAIANAFAKAISADLQSSAVAQIDSSIKGIHTQLRRLSTQDAGLRATLQQQLLQLTAARSTQGSEAAILQAATPSHTPVGTSLRTTLLLAALIGLLLGIGAVVLAENADRRLRTPDDLEGMTHVPLLAAIAPTIFSESLDTRPEDLEAFNMLRTALMYFNGDRPMDSIVVTSAGEQEGKTTVAARLAINVARAGKRVILVDADLRRAAVGPRLGIKPGVGLSDVLAGQATLSEAILEYQHPEFTSGSLGVLAAGTPPPNPAAMLSGRDMRHVLHELESRSEFLIIDTPAALAVSDGLPLMREVDGVVLVGRMNRSNRETIRRLQRMINSLGGTLVGVVATGATSGPGYDDYSPKYYTREGHSQGFFRRLRRPRKRTTVNYIARNGGPPVRAGSGRHGHPPIVFNGGAHNALGASANQVAAEQVAVDELALDEAAVDGARVDEPVVDEPAVDARAVDEAAADEEPVDEEPVDEEPVDEEAVDEVAADDAEANAPTASDK